MNTANYPIPSKERLQELKKRILDRIYDHHLRLWGGSAGNVFFISDTYPGLWLEHTFDGIVFADYMPTEHAVSAEQVRLFLSHQREDGQLPCYIWANEVGYGQIQECVSFGSLCLDAVRQNPQDKTLLSDCYEGVSAWVGWLKNNRRTLQTPLIEMFCGYDTGHDNSGRLNGLKYHGNTGKNAAWCPDDDAALPILAPDMNANFYGNHIALARMAELLGQTDAAAAWRAEAEVIRRAMFAYLWDDDRQFFYDVDRNGQKRYITSCSITNVFLEGVMDDALGNAVFDRYIASPDHFWTPYPLPAVSVSDPTWVCDRPGNSWGFYSQGLTALRTLRWMPKYGRTAEMEAIMHRWVSAWSRSTSVQFGQELHPITGEPSASSQWYSSCMLYFLYALKHLYGI